MSTTSLGFRGHLKEAGKAAYQHVHGNLSSANQAIKDEGFWKAVSNGFKNSYKANPLLTIGVVGGSIVVGAVAGTAVAGHHRRKQYERDLVASQGYQR